MNNDRIINFTKNRLLHNFCINQKVSVDSLNRIQEVKKKHKIMNPEEKRYLGSLKMCSDSVSNIQQTN
jgi:hypothetical protein